MRILITGASGFVGQHLSRVLVQSRQRVFGTFLQHDEDSFPPAVEMMHCDLRQMTEVEKVIVEVRPQQIYHLAALSSVRDSFENSRIVYDANFMGSFNLLEAVRRARLSARILVVSTGHCYGHVKRSRQPVSETEPLAPDSPYGVSKAAADLLAGQYFVNHRLEVIRARPFNHTGPGQPASFVCSDFARQCAAIELGLSDPVIRVGNVHARRDFSDVRDIVRAYVLLMRKGKPGEAYNVGSGQAISIRHILSILKSLCSRKIQVIVEDQRLRRGEADILYGSNRKIMHATGWTPRIELETTLKDSYLYWKEILSRRPSAKIKGSPLPQ